MQIFETEMKAASARVAQSLATPTPHNKHVGTVNGRVESAKDASTTSTADPSSDITSNDFLTLLVTEMKNQDPTQPTDPNAYIQQLVGVNSLQQLISINQELGSVTTPPTGGAVTAPPSNNSSRPITSTAANS